MGKSLGGSASASNTSTNSSENYTKTPTNPAWSTAGVQGIANNLTNLGTYDPYSFVAGANPLQTTAAAGASALTPNNQAYGSAEGLFQGLQDASTPQVTAATGRAASLLPNISSYMSPYVNNVVNSSLADYNFGAGQTQAGNKLALANDDTFGGSGGAIQTSMSNDAIDRGRASLVSGLLNTGYDTAGTLSNEDADRKQQMSLANMTANNQAQQFNAGQVETALNRQLQAGNGMVNAANSQNTSAVNDLTTQSGIGQILQQIHQAQAGAPLSVAGSLAGDWSQLPLSLFTGQTGTDKKSGNSTTLSASAKIGL